MQKYIFFTYLPADLKDNVTSWERRNAADHSSSFSLSPSEFYTRLVRSNHRINNRCVSLSLNSIIHSLVRIVWNGNPCQCQNRERWRRGREGRGRGVTSLLVCVFIHTCIEEKLIYLCIHILKVWGRRAEEKKEGIRKKDWRKGEKRGNKKKKSGEKRMLGWGKRT